MSSIITAGTTRTQAGATLITADIVTVNTSTANSGGTLVGDGVCLPQIGSGTDRIFLINNTANWVQAYGYLNPNGTYDSIDGIAGSQGVAIPAYSSAIFIEATPGSWSCHLDSAPEMSYNTNTATASMTLTAANCSGASAEVVLALTGSASAGVAATLPTVAALLASLPAPALGTSYKLRVVNSTGQTVTMTTNTGWTITGTAAISTANWRDYIVTITGVGASPTATLQNVGGAPTF